MALGRTALIAGATGLVGARVLARLLSSPAYETVHALLRRALPAHQRPAPDGAVALVEHLIDFDAIGRMADFPAVDDVYLTLGTTIRTAGSQEAFRRIDFDAVVSVARRARRLGASRCVVVSAIGADPGARVFYSRVKGETEAALSRLDYPSLTVLRPSLLDGDRTESRPGERFALAVSRPLVSLIPARWRPVSVDTVAQCMVDACLRGESGLRIIESDRIAAGAI